MLRVNELANNSFEKYVFKTSKLRFQKANGKFTTFNVYVQKKVWIIVNEFFYKSTDMKSYRLEGVGSGEAKPPNFLRVPQT